MWVGARVHLLLLCDVPSLVSQTIVAGIEHLTPIFFCLILSTCLYSFLGEFCEDECPGHTSW